MPFGEYKDFDDCVAQNSDKSDPKAYCGYIKNQIEGAATAPSKSLKDIFSESDGTFSDFMARALQEGYTRSQISKYVEQDAAKESSDSYGTTGFAKQVAARETANKTFSYHNHYVEIYPDEEGTFNVNIDGELQKDAWDSESEAEFYAKAMIDDNEAENAQDVDPSYAENRYAAKEVSWNIGDRVKFDVGAGSPSTVEGKITKQLTPGRWQIETDHGNTYARYDADLEQATKKEVAHEMSGDWNQRYDQAQGNLKSQLDKTAQEMFNSAFKDLDTDEQKKVIDWLGADRMMDEANKYLEQSAREMSKTYLGDILKKAGNFQAFFDAARREGYTDDEIQTYLTENNQDTERTMNNGGKEISASNATVHDSNYDPEWDVNYESIGGGRYKVIVNDSDLGEANSIQDAKRLVREYMDDQAAKHGE